jgi:hypothetical protein
LPSAQDELAAGGEDRQEGDEGETEDRMDTGTLIRVVAGILFVIVLFIIIKRRRSKASQ